MSTLRHQLRYAYALGLHRMREISAIKTITQFYVLTCKESVLPCSELITCHQYTTHFTTSVLCCISRPCPYLNSHEYPTYITEPGATVSDLAFPARDQMK